MTDKPGRKWPPDSFDNFAEDEEASSMEPFQGEDSSSKNVEKPSFFDFTASEEPIDSEIAESAFPWETDEQQIEERENPIPPPADQDLEALFGSNGHSYKAETIPSASLENFLKPLKKEKPITENYSSVETSSRDPELEMQSEPTDETVTQENDERSKVIAEDSNQYRAYAKYDFLSQDIVKEGSKKRGIQLNTQAIVLVVTVLAVGGWFGYGQIFGNRYKYASKRTDRKRVKPIAQKDVFAEEAEQLPLWGISNPNKQDAKAELATITAAKNRSGRDNPFAIPESVLVIIKKDLETKLAKEEPKMLKKYAYRATLVGLVTANNKTLALVNLRTASFEVKEETEKEKIIQEATKAMNREKDEPLELINGDIFGPGWAITKLNDGKSDGSEAIMIIQRENEELTLQLGIPTELGIYNDKGEIDTFKEDLPSEQIAATTIANP